MMVRPPTILPSVTGIRLANMPQNLAPNWPAAKRPAGRKYMFAMECSKLQVTKVMIGK